MPKGAPTSIAFNSNTTIVAGSTDTTVSIFNLKTGQLIRRFRGHSGIVNSVDVQRGGGGQNFICSGSDDGTVRVWREDSREEVEIVELGYPITAVRFSSPSYLVGTLLTLVNITGAMVRGWTANLHRWSR